MGDPMSDMHQFVKMIAKAGYEHTIYPKSDCRFTKPGDRKTIYVIKNVIEVIVKGSFYDDLCAYFDREGGLLSMDSHVARMPTETQAIRDCGLPVEVQS
jgi:hypothetical protein